LTNTVAKLKLQKLWAAEAACWRAECAQGDNPEVVGRLEALARQSERDVYVLKVAQQVLRGQPGSPWNSLSF